MPYTFKHGDRPLDDFTIQRAVGCGGFGEVYYALSDGGREVALKYLKANPQIELRGVSHCINLKSPHLVSIFDVKKNTDGEYFIIMEYCSGPSLRDLLVAEPNGFGPQKAAFFIREIGKGLAYLHDRGIVHRDLKPGNIFYDDGYVKIGDYGLSKFISISRHSAQTASVGTVHYMAPEIGSGNYSRGIDIYALGVMLYEMLMGKVPFEGSTMGEVLMKHLTTQPEVDQLPAPFASVIRKALEKDPQNRYQTVDEMLEELLSVEEVKKSLAGFSTRSLDGAVGRGAQGVAPSPMPSPNPFPGHVRDFDHKAEIPGRVAPPIVGGPPLQLPPGIAKKVNRISQKIERKMAKLAGRKPRRRSAHGPGGPAPAMPGHRGDGLDAAGLAAGSRGFAQSRGHAGRRVFLTVVLGAGLAAGLGILVGIATDRHQFGLASGFLVAAMSGGLLLSRKVGRWFDVLYGPRWACRFIQVGCAGPLMGLAAIPLLADHRFNPQGLTIWLGLLAVTALARWDKIFTRSPEDDVRFGCAFWTAVGAVITTAIAGSFFEETRRAGLVGVEVGDIVLVSGGIAGVVSLILQAMVWSLQPSPESSGWDKPETSSAPTPEGGSGSSQGGDVDGDALPPFARPADGSAHAATATADPDGRVARWAATRAFWGVMAFCLMGGAIVTFILALVVDLGTRDENTGMIVGSIACASWMIFALRKTTPLKRDGFVRESLKPFLFSLALFGIGGTVTAISRHWAEFQGEEQALCIVGLVFSSMLFLASTFVIGRKPRGVRTRPFFQAGVIAVDPESVVAGLAAVLGGDDAPDESDEPEKAPRQDG